MHPPNRPGGTQFLLREGAVLAQARTRPRAVLYRRGQIMVRCPHGPSPNGSPPRTPSRTVAERSGRMLWRRSKVSLSDAALAYAELGIPVFPSHWPTVASARRPGPPGVLLPVGRLLLPGRAPPGT